MVYYTRSKQNNEEVKFESIDQRPTKKGKKLINKQVQTMDDQKNNIPSIKKQKVSNKKKETKRIDDEGNDQLLEIVRKSEEEEKKEEEISSENDKMISPVKRKRNFKVEKEKDHDHDKDNILKKEKNISGTIDIGNISESIKNEGVSLENGHIYFFYHPKMKGNGKESNQSTQYKQSLFMLLIPQDVEPTDDHYDEKRTPSLIFICSKKTPVLKNQEKQYGYVFNVSDNIGQLLKDIKEHTYTAKTRNKRLVQSSRILGIGAYNICHQHDKHNSYLSYILTYPESYPPAQKFKLKKEGTFTFSIKNPNVPDLSSGEDETNIIYQLSLSEKRFNQHPNFPNWLQTKFGDLRYLSIKETTLFLNYPGSQISLVNTKTSIDVDEIGANAVVGLNLIIDNIKQKPIAHIVEHDLKSNLSDYCIAPLKQQ